MKQPPFISVVIPVKEIGYHIIFENLPHVAKQSYQNFEVIILPNQHTQYDIELLKKYKWLRIIPTGKITRPALKRNMGVKEAKGEIIAFIDDDAFPSEKWLEKAVHFFEKNKVEAVCGPGSLPPHTNIWEVIFDYVLRSWLGAGGYAYRFIAQKERYVDDYPSMNFLIKKSVFNKLGGFNNDYWPGEDSKLCEDLVYKLKGKIYYHPDILIYHHRRNNLNGYLKQHGNYGYHRGAFFAHGDKNSRRVSYLIPTFFVLYLVLLTVTRLTNLFIIIPLFVHMIMFIPLILYSVFAAILLLITLVQSKNLLVALGSVYVLFLTHVVYGIMFIKGFVKGITAKDAIYE